MPRIDDPAPSVKFKKKSYRPWGEDLFGEKSTIGPFLEETLEKPVESQATTAERQGEKLVTIHAVAENEPSIPCIDNVKAQKQLGNNKGTIGEQLGNKLGSNRGTIGEQKGNKKTIKILDKGTIGKQLENILGNNWGTESKNQVVGFDTLIERIQIITGHQKKILFFIVDDCISAGDLTTGQISNETLRTLLNTDSSTVKESIKRLINKGLITRKGGKRGCGGFSRYIVTDVVKKAVIQEKKKTSIGEQLGNNWGANRGTNAASSSSNILKTTTTSESIISDNWKSVDIEPLRGINFTEAHLKQLISQQKLSPEQVQASINAFAFDLNENARAKKITQDAVSFFMGILRKGNLYIPPSNYESPDDKAMRLYSERMREIEKARSAQEQKVVEYAFVEWSETMPDQEKNKIAAPLPSGSNGFIACLKEFFLKNIWPSKKQEILGLGQTNTEVTTS